MVMFVFWCPPDLKWSYLFGQIYGSAKVHLGLVSCRLFDGCWAEVCFVRRSFFKCCVGSVVVVEFNPVVDDTLGFGRLGGQVRRPAGTQAKAIERHMLAGQAIFVDDTSLKMLSPSAGKTKTARLWAYVRDERPWASEAPQAAFYRFSLPRAVKNYLFACGVAVTPTWPGN